MNIQQYLEDLIESLDLFQDALANSNLKMQSQNEIQIQIDCIKASIEIIECEIQQGLQNA